MGEGSLLERLGLFGAFAGASGTSTVLRQGDQMPLQCKIFNMQQIMIKTKHLPHEQVEAFTAHCSQAPMLTVNHRNEIWHCRNCFKATVEVCARRWSSEWFFFV